MAGTPSRPTARAVVAVALAALAATGCSSDDAVDPAADATDDATSEPVAAPATSSPAPVIGARTLTRGFVGSDVALGFAAATDAPEADVNAVLDRVGALLDDHLAAVADDTASPLLAVMDPALRADPVATQLLERVAPAADPVEAATYDLRVQASTVVEWLEAEVHTRTASGAAAAALLVFTVDDALAPTLVGLGELPVEAEVQP